MKNSESAYYKFGFVEMKEAKVLISMNLLKILQKLYKLII